MALLGRFAVAGHDRGSYVAFRMAMDHPAVITHLAVLDSVPIGEALRRADATFAAAWWHWFFYAQPDLPERAILADPDAWYRAGPHRADQMGAGNYADFHAAVHNPDLVIAILEDCARAWASTVQTTTLTGPTTGNWSAPLVAWSRRDGTQRLYGDVLDVCKSRARDLTGLAINSGHHVGEDNPTDLAAALADHFHSTSRD